MNKFFKKINNSLMNKKSQTYETDAAPSRPRPEGEISDLSDSSDDEEEFVSSGNNTKHKQPKPDDEEIPEFKKSEANPSSMGGHGGQTYTQTIYVSHSNGIQFGNQYHFNIQKPSGQKTNSTAEEVPSQPSKPQPPPPPPPKIEKTFSNREPAQTTDFISIKFDIGNWRGVAEQLGLSSGAIQQVHEKYKEKGISEVFYQLMLKWKESQPRATSTVGLLCEALWNSNETRAANILSKLHPPK